jgi:aminopeptidase-like protein
MTEIGHKMYRWATELYPICRSITGPGVRKTLEYIKEIIPELKIKAVPSGTQVFDWTVPDEWSIKSAYIEDEQGDRIVDFKNNNLHVVGYSEPINQWMSLDELSPHLHFLPNRPNSIPYVTSYYVRNWGFCITQNQREKLKAGNYHVVIDSEIKPGILNYAELILPGIEEKEIFISTYICHPSMANNELSGPILATALAKWIQSIPNRRYTYRIIFIPETIGSIMYLATHHEILKANVIAGFNLTCVGDDRAYSFLPSRHGDTLADQAALYALESKCIRYTKYDFLTRGSDERQYCWPGIDLPVVSVMRSKYGTYPEYHTSDDNLDLITPSGLFGALSVHRDALLILEMNAIYECTILCEPNLGKRGLYPLISTLENKQRSRNLIDFMAYCDGNHDLISIARKINKPLAEITTILKNLTDSGLIRKRY